MSSLQAVAVGDKAPQSAHVRPFSCRARVSLPKSVDCSHGTIARIRPAIVVQVGTVGTHKPNAFGFWKPLHVFQALKGEIECWPLGLIARKKESSETMAAESYIGNVECSGCPAKDRNFRLVCPIGVRRKCLFVLTIDIENHDSCARLYQ